MTTLLPEVLTSMPGVGVRTAARILVEIGDASSFPAPGTWLPTPAWPQSPGAPAPPSEANTRPGAATNA